MLLTLGANAQQNRFNYSLSLVEMNMDYKEYDDNEALLDSENSDLGDLIGYEMNLAYLFNINDAGSDEVAIRVMNLYGKSTYRGSILGSSDPYGTLVSRTKNRFIEGDVSYRHTYVLKKRYHISYGIALGYHGWNRELSSVQEELYEWFFIRPMVGVSADMRNFNLGALIRYQYGFNATMTSSNPSLEFRLGSVDVFEIAFPVRYDFSDRLDIFAEATFTKQIIKKSNSVTSGVYTYYEPDSTSSQNYLKLGMTFKF